MEAGSYTTVCTGTEKKTNDRAIVLYAEEWAGMTCLNCGRKLKSAASMKAGYGPVCYRKMFGSSLRSSRKNRVSEEADTPCYNIPGQMTIEEFLQTNEK